MPVPYPPNWAPGVQGAQSPALDALQMLGSASPSSGTRPNPHRLTETPESPADGGYLTPPQSTGPIRSYPPPATPPIEEPFGIPRMPCREQPYSAAMQGLMTLLPGPKLEQ